MSMLAKVGRFGWVVVVVLGLLALPAAAADKVIDLGGGADKAAEKPAAKDKAPEKPAAKATEKVAEKPAEQPQDVKAADAAGDTLLQQLTKEEKWRQERAKFLADHYTQSGIARFNELDYEAAKVEFEKAIQQDPTKKEAKEYLRKVDAILGVRQGPIIQDVGKTLKWEYELVRQEMRVGFDKAQQAYEKGEFAESLDMFKKVREMITWLGPYTDVEPQKSKTEEFIKKATVEKDMQEKLQKEAERKKADEVALMNEQYLQDRYDMRIAKLLGKSRDLLQETRYEEAKATAESVLELDPQNVEARKLRDIAFNSGLGFTKSETSRHSSEETQLSWAQTKEAQVPYSEILIYPSNWAEIIKRQVGVIGAETEEEPPWMPDLKGKLEQKVSFDFVETPLQDVVTFLQQITNATIILDARSLSGLASPEVTLKVTDMKLSQALEWILSQVGLQYALNNNAILIGNQDAVGGDAQLKLYDVTDVTLEIRDFPGNLAALRDRIGTSSTGSGATTTMEDPWGGEGTPGGEKTTFTGETLVDFIMKTIAPGTWTGSDAGGEAGNAGG